MISVPLCLPLSASAVITEDPVTDEGVVEMLARHHHIASEWAVLMSENYVVTSPFLDDRQNCPVPAYTPSILKLQEPRLTVAHLYHHLTHPSLEYNIIVAKIDEVVAVHHRDGERRCCCVCSFDIIHLSCCYRSEQEDVALYIQTFFSSQFKMMMVLSSV